MATRRFTLYGSSPDALAAQNRFYDQLNLGAAESNRGAMMNAAAQNIANAERIRQEDEAAMVRDRNERLAYLKLFADEATNRRLSAEDSRRFDASMNLSDRQLAAQIARDKLSGVDVGEARRNNYFNKALLPANEGLYESLEDVRRQNPGLSDDEAAQVFALNQNARRMVSQATEQPRRAAATLNALSDAEAKLTGVSERLKLTPQYGDAIESLRPSWKGLLTPPLLGAPTTVKRLWALLNHEDSPEYTRLKTQQESLDRESKRLKLLADSIRANEDVMGDMGIPDERGRYSTLLPWETRTSPRINALAPRTTAASRIGRFTVQQVD